MLCELWVVGSRIFFSRDDIIINQFANEEYVESTVFRPHSIAEFNIFCVAYTRLIRFDRKY